ncbi:hypothetical protein SAMN06297144_1089 [Sphingomonas guangdongensis]|uniref:Uncharacterized protein n=1 Tax=Sphingomonas guangdongensis TaxID=1141890 RepID=A0A285QG88_9SPHN|nr:hypothetical protein [Sphingomonas guangdongensis]SOB80494.1 hypothetical protein SAMN06297144_1089 [Sphingomonas guangdongensis]
MRKVLGTLAGVVVAVITITLVELIGHRVYPAPAGLDLTPEGVARYLESAPAGAMIAVVLGWFAGALLGGWTALAITRWSVAPWIIAGLIAAAGIYNATQIPAPLWMQVATVLAPALGGWLALHLGRRTPA